MKARIKFVGASDEQVLWGGRDDPRLHLIEGGVYELEREDVHTWHTDYELVDFPGLNFPSVAFEPQIED